MCVPEAAPMWLSLQARPDPTLIAAYALPGGRPLRHPVTRIFSLVYSFVYFIIL